MNMRHVRASLEDRGAVRTLPPDPAGQSFPYRRPPLLSTTTVPYFRLLRDRSFYRPRPVDLPAPDDSYTGPAVAAFPLSQRIARSLQLGFTVSAIDQPQVMASKGRYKEAPAQLEERYLCWSLLEYYHRILLFMKNPISFVRNYADKLQPILGRRVIRFLFSSSSALTCIDVLKDQPHSSNGLSSSHDDIWFDIDRMPAMAFRENEYFAVDYCYEISKDQINEDVEMINIRTILANHGWSLGCNSWHRIELNEFNVIRVLDILFYENFDAALAQYFFRWSERCTGIKHTIRSLCTMVHIMVTSNKNCRAVDLILYMIRRYCKDNNSYDLLIHILHQTHRERKILELVYSMLVDCYIDEGMVNTAYCISYKIKQLNIFPSLGVCNKLIERLLQLKQLNMAWDFFEEMQNHGIAINASIICLFIHDCCARSDIGKAWKMIALMNNHGIRADVVSYSIIIHSLCRMSCLKEATCVFFKMLQARVHVDSVLISSLVDGYCKVGNLHEAMNVLKINNIHLNIYLYSSFITRLCRDNDMLNASDMFHRMTEGYAKHGLLNEIFELLSIMRSMNTPPDIVSYNILIHCLILKGFMHEANNILEELIQRGFSPDKVTFTTFINGHSRRGDFKEAFLAWFNMSEKQIEPDLITCSALLSGYCKVEKMEEANALFKMMLNTGMKPDVILFNTLIHGFCRTGNIFDACEMVRTMVQHSILPNNTTYRALILGFEKNHAVNPSEIANVKLQEILRTCGIHSGFGE
ncbi:hypothetical protein SAY86_011068 [Trapa natans]|uniref:Pentatricopeptide repeat-containing protein n=1 Tax=Trapa natans TaxID=22666 RepID=A0AAN7R3W0_TRANT|nr:hypothetical protein SAY86_011068 [Trapa natans]